MINMVLCSGLFFFFFLFGFKGDGGVIRDVGETVSPTKKKKKKKKEM